jgi:ArsR family transcriptional regulator, zinc-responsive transcriptional repressor
MKTKLDDKLTSLAGMTEAAECLRTLSHPHRLRMVQMLLEGERPVAEVAEACKIQSHMASEHLIKMRDRGLLKSERRGRQIFYSIAEPHLRSIMDCIEARFT